MSIVHSYTHLTPNHSAPINFTYTAAVSSPAENAMTSFKFAASALLALADTTSLSPPPFLLATVWTSRLFGATGVSIADWIPGRPSRLCEFLLCQ